MFGFVFFIGVHPYLFAQQIISPPPTAPAIAADTIPLNGNGTIESIEIDQLIVDETISKAGYDFQELFFTLWSWPPALEESFILVVTERPYRGISTQIIISVNDQIVFESFLQPRYEVLEALAQSAIEQASGYLINYAAIQQQLGSDDTRGTGIY